MAGRRLCRYLMSEFHCFHLWFVHDDWKPFAYSPWIPYWWQVQLLYAVYRCTLSFYFVVWLVYNTINAFSTGSTGRYFSHLTNWSFIVWNIYLFLSAVSVSFNQLRRYPCCSRRQNHARPPKQHCSRTCSYDKTTLCDKVSWLLFTVSSELAVAVTVLYWGLQRTDDTLPHDSVANLHTHLVNGIVAVLDIWIIGFPIHLFHLFYTIVFMSSYAVFNGVQYATVNNSTGSKNSYPVFDYNSEPGLAVGVVFGMSFGLLPLIHVLFVLQYLCRSWVTSQLHKRVKVYHKYCSSDILEEHSDVGTGETGSNRGTFSTTEFDV